MRGLFPVMSRPVALPPQTGGRSPVSICFLLVPGFPMMALTAAVEPLRSANHMSGQNLYEWKLASEDGLPVASGAKLQLVTDISIQDAEHFDYVFVAAGLDVDDYRNRHVYSWLKRQAAADVTLGALSTGTMLLARAGVPLGRCTIHWESQRQLKEEFPDLTVTNDLYCIDGNRMTCAGGISALDMVLSMISAHHGPDLAAQVAEQFLHSRIRDSDETQRMDLHWRYGVTEPKVIAAIRLMEEHQEDPLLTHDIAHLLDCSQRQLERLFATTFGQSPKEFYSIIRLKSARHLLLHSNLTLEEISRRTGFSSSSHMGRRFLQYLGTSPSEIRHQVVSGKWAGPVKG